MQRWENWMREKRIEAIVPVPMYSKKERYRGYNQAALFGRALSENGYSVYSASDDPGERYTATERTEWQRKRK